MTRNYLAVLTRWNAKILSFNALWILPLVLLAALPGCSGEYFYGNHWIRQDADDGNTAFRFVTLGSEPFTGQQKPLAIPAWAVKAVTLGYDDKLYIARHDKKFEVYDPKTGLPTCPSIGTDDDMTSAPTIGDNRTAYVGGQFGNVWRFDTVSGVKEQGWPVKVGGTGTGGTGTGGEISGSVILYGNSLIAATVEGNVYAIDRSDGHQIWGQLKHNFLEGLPNIQTAMVSSIKGSPALVKVYNQNSGKVESLVLVSTDRGLVGLSADDGKPRGFYEDESLVAGPSIGLVNNSWMFAARNWLATRSHSPRFIAKMFWRSQKIAVVPQNRAVLAVYIDIPFRIAWPPYQCPACPAGFQFTDEASINAHDVFLSASTALIGLDLTSGLDKWAPINLNNSGAQRPATTDQGTNGYVYVAVGNKLSGFNGSDGTLVKEATLSGVGQLIVRPSISSDGTVFTGDNGNIFQFH